MPAIWDEGDVDDGGDGKVGVEVGDGRSYPAPDGWLPGGLAGSSRNKRGLFPRRGIEGNRIERVV